MMLLLEIKDCYWSIHKSLEIAMEQCLFVKLDLLWENRKNKEKQEIAYLSHLKVNVLMKVILEKRMSFPLRKNSKLD